MTVGDHINIHGSIISYNIVKNKIRFKYTWVHKNDQNVLYALSSNYLSDKRRGKIRQRTLKHQTPKPEGHEAHHESHPTGNPTEAGQPMQHTDLGTRRRQDQVAWAGGNGGDHRKQTKGKSVFGGHGGGTSSFEKR